MKQKYYLLILFAFIISCNDISEGLQRHKFEYLYKLNNYAVLLREFTNNIIYFKDLGIYKVKLEKLYEDINKIKTVDGWGTSRVLKEKFLTLIEENTGTADTLSKKNIPSDKNIRKEYDVIIMHERVDKYITELNDEISKTGKE
jgi:hypothetical protein